MSNKNNNYRKEHGEWLVDSFDRKYTVNNIGKQHNIKYMKKMNNKANRRDGKKDINKQLEDY